MSNKFVELNHNNNSNTVQKCSLNYNGGNIITSQTNLWLYKFNIKCTNFPLYIPNIIDIKDAINYIHPDIRNKTTIDLKNINHKPCTDWVISLEFIDNETNKLKYMSIPVYWGKHLDNETMNTDTSNILYNEDFHLNNSSQLCGMINNAFDYLTNGLIFISKNESRWSLMVNSTHTEMNRVKGIYFSPSMQRYFGFNYLTESGKIAIERHQTYTANNQSYHMITTPNSTNTLFMWDKLIFKSENLNIPPLYTNTENINFVNVIDSYDLIVSDISSIAASMSYVSQNKDRSHSLNSLYLEKFQIFPYLVSSKHGYEYPIMLKPGESASMSFMIY